MTANTVLKNDLNLVNSKNNDIQSQILPAGGFDRDRFDWLEAWYPIFYTEDLDKAKPAKFTLLERDLVIWWDRQTNAWKAFDD
ncbi:MAG: cell death suppressor protein Lls1, partial [Pseudanabaena sp.]